MLQKSEVIEKLKDYIVKSVLDGRDIGLDASTPLLEWGVINSFEMIRLLEFIRSQFGVDIPARLVVADHFSNLEAISSLVMEIQQSNVAQ